MGYLTVLTHVKDMYSETHATITDHNTSAKVSIAVSAVTQRAEYAGTSILPALPAQRFLFLVMTD